MADSPPGRSSTPRPTRSSTPCCRTPGWRSRRSADVAVGRAGAGDPHGRGAGAVARHRRRRARVGGLLRRTAGVRLSLGHVTDDTVVCPYHAWNYDGTGRCTLIPAHPELTPPERARANVLGGDRGPRAGVDLARHPRRRPAADRVLGRPGLLHQGALRALRVRGRGPAGGRELHRPVPPRRGARRHPRRQGVAAHAALRGGGDRRRALRRRPGDRLPGAEGRLRHLAGALQPPHTPPAHRPGRGAARGPARTPSGSRAARSGPAARSRGSGS